MVFGGGPLNTLKLVQPNILLFLSRYMKMYFLLFQEYFNSILLVMSIKVIMFSKAFKCLHYKKVFLDENPKKKVFRHEKNQKKQQKYKNVLQKKFMSDYV